MGGYHDVHYAFDSQLTETDLRELLSSIDDTYAVRTCSDATSSQSDDADLDQQVNDLTSGQGGSVQIQFSDSMQCSLLYVVSPAANTVRLEYPTLTLKIPDSLFMSPPADMSTDDVVDLIDRFYELVIDLYEQCVSIGRTPRYVYGLTGEDEMRIGNPQFDVFLDDDRIDDDELPGVYWCQIVPPSIVSNVGSERLLSTPGYRAEELSDGAIFHVAHEFPEEYADMQELADHLGVEYDMPYDPHA